MKIETKRKKNSLQNVLKRWLKQLLAPIVREVIEEREKEITLTIRRVVSH